MINLAKLFRADTWREAGPGRDLEIAAAILAKKALLDGSADTGGFRLRLLGCHVRGEAWGDWEFTARRIASPAQVGRNAKRQDPPSGLGPQGEHAVGAEGADAPNPSQSGPSS